jgi:hypothetical protein
MAGCQESIYSGVTTVVDHAHMTYSPEHATEAIRATASSGLRSFFCYTPIWRIKRWGSDGPVEYDKDLLPEWWFSTLKTLAKAAPFGDGRVMLGLGFDDFKLPRETVQDLWTRCRSLGINLFTTHYVANYMTSKPPTYSGICRTPKNTLRYSSQSRLHLSPRKIRPPRQNCLILTHKRNHKSRRANPTRARRSLLLNPRDRAANGARRARCIQPGSKMQCLNRHRLPLK